MTARNQQSTLWRYVAWCGHVVTRTEFRSNPNTCNGLNASHAARKPDHQPAPSDRLAPLRAADARTASVARSVLGDPGAVRRRRKR